MPLMTTSQEYLQAYDRQLRTDAETPSAIAVVRLGPLRLVTFAGGRGFVTYQNLGGADAVTIAGWVGEALAHYRADAAITRLEWKTRGHDRAPGLHDALVSSGFVADEPESIMIGEARRLAVDVALPGEVGLREVTSEPDVRAMCAMQAEVFGDPDAEDTANAVLRRLATGDGMQLWVAKARRADRQRRPARAGRRDRVRRDLGRGHAAGVAGPGDLPGPHRGPGTLSARAGQTADAQRLDRVLPARPGAGGAGQGLYYDALHVAPVRISGRVALSVFRCKRDWQDYGAHQAPQPRARQDRSSTHGPPLPP